MSEPTPEQKRKTILLARQMSKNMCEQQLFPLLKEWVDWQREIRAIPTPWNQPRQAKPSQPEPDQAELLAVLAEAKARREKR